MNDCMVHCEQLIDWMVNETFKQRTNTVVRISYLIWTHIFLHPAVYPKAFEYEEGKSFTNIPQKANAMHFGTFWALLKQGLGDKRDDIIDQFVQGLEQIRNPKEPEPTQKKETHKQKKKSQKKSTFERQGTGLFCGARAINNALHRPGHVTHRDIVETVLGKLCEQGLFGSELPEDYYHMEGNYNIDAIHLVCQRLG